MELAPSSPYVVSNGLIHSYSGFSTLILGNLAMPVRSTSTDLPMAQTTTLSFHGLEKRTLLMLAPFSL